MPPAMKAICIEKNGFTLFSTMRNHYNLLYREDERERIIRSLDSIMG